MKTYHLMKNLIGLAFAALLLCGNLPAQKPGAPLNLKVDTIIGHAVSLSWTNPDKGELLFESGFEKANPDDLSPSFEQGWTVKSTNTSYYACSWFNFPTKDFLEVEYYEDLIHSGKKSAAVFLDPVEDEHPMHQDEWLISPTVAGAAYLTFYSYIDPRILTDGADTNFPDHYVVVVSTDNGQTWSEPLWDARYDASPKDSWQKVELSLADMPTDKMQVAFRAYGDYKTYEEDGDTVNMGLFLSWFIDDVAIYGSSSDDATVAKYKITLDGTDLVSTSNGFYTDNSKKTEGKHTYAVYSVAFDGTESEAATVEVELEELIFAAPRNFTCTPTLEPATGRYTVTMTWDAPESKFQPVSYTIYNGNLTFAVELTEENGKEGFGMTGCLGIYQFSIVAVYESPDGESEPEVRNLALGVRFGANDLRAETSGKDVVLSWKEPYESEFKTASYTLYRSGEKLAEGLKELTYRDTEVANGLYQYSVVAVYEDGVEGVRTNVSHQVGEQVRVKMPYSQAFNTTFCPENWKVVNQSVRTPDRFSWYFDDQSRLGIKGRGFEGCYAAIDFIDAPGYSRNATLELPAIDLSSAKDRSSITLSFYYSYALGGIAKVGTEWSIDGEEWYILEMIDKETGFVPGEDGDFHIQQAVHRIGAYEELAALMETVQTLYLRIHYEGSMSKFFAVDNVLVAADGVAIEQAAEAPIDVTVSSLNGMMNVKASQAIQRIEVFSVQGTRIADQKGNNDTFQTMPVPQKGIAIVRVTTQGGVKVVKTLL